MRVEKAPCARVRRRLVRGIYYVQIFLRILEMLGNETVTSL